MNTLFRLNDTLRRDPRIEAWFSDFADPHRLSVRPWFERMRGCGADVREIFHDGCPVACVGDAPFGYVNAFKAYASVGFFHGAMLLDPAGVLRLVQKHKWKLAGPTRLRVDRVTSELRERAAAVRQVMEVLATAAIRQAA